MQNITIRPAAPDDIPILAELWYEKKVIESQSDRRFRFQSQDIKSWSTALEGWLADSRCCVLVAQGEVEIYGYIIGWTQSNPPGIVPQRVGAVTELVVGAHSYQSGLGRTMLQPLREWFSQQGIKQIIAYVHHRQPIEQAFWRALGAKEWIDLMWME